MKVLVTGGLGLVGKSVVERMRRDGYQLKVVDRQAEAEIEGVEYASCDITDYTALREQVRGCDSIVHLAAIPYPGGGSGPEIFRINCAGTFNVYEAAAAEGIRRVACASSINALGFNFGIKSFPLHYFPIDEEHPTHTTDAYSFSKQVLEDIAAYYWRREGITSVSFRFPWVYTPDSELREMGKTFVRQYHKLLDGVLAKPEPERTDLMRQVVAQFDENRARRMYEKPWEDRREEWEPDWNDPSLLVFFGYTDFWSVVSGEDAAVAFERGLQADIEGSQVFFINEYWNMAGVEAETLAQLFYPDVTLRQRALESKECLVSIDKARRMLGFQPEGNILAWIEADGAPAGKAGG
jgi:nucleoside-diphosphate-sugar epimerase